MIEAMLLGKLSSKQENMEDVVTSNVFGLLQYVAPQSGVIPLLFSNQECTNMAKAEATVEVLVGMIECAKPGAVPNNADQGCRFVHEMKVGDLIA